MVNASTYNTFYDNVRVGDDAVVADVNKGWHLITNQLNYERVSLGPPGMVERVYDEVRRWTQDTKLPDGRRVADQEWVQLNLARVHAKLEFVKLINWKVAAAGGANPADASATKVFATEFYTEAYRLLMEILGPNAYLPGLARRTRSPGRLERAFQGALILTFGGGVNEVQRDLIALFGLGPAPGAAALRSDRWTSPSPTSSRRSPTWPTASSSEQLPARAPPRARADRRRGSPTTCGPSSARPTSSASRCPRPTAAAATASSRPA